MLKKSNCHLFGPISFDNRKPLTCYLSFSRALQRFVYKDCTPSSEKVQGCLIWREHAHNLKIAVELNFFFISLLNFSKKEALASICIMVSIVRPSFEILSTSVLLKQSTASLYVDSLVVFQDFLSALYTGNPKTSCIVLVHDFDVEVECRVSSMSDFAAAALVCWAVFGSSPEWWQLKSTTRVIISA